MRAIQTIASLSSQHGGPTRSVGHLTSALADRGCESVIVSLRGASERAPLMPDNHGVAVHLARVGNPKVPWAVAAFTDSLRRELRRGGAVVVHDHGLWLPTNHRSATETRRFHVPRISSPRGMLSEWSLRQHWLKKRLAWLAFQREDLSRSAVLHVTSNQELHEVRRLGIRTPVAVIPNGVRVPSAVPRRHSTSMRRAVFLSRIHPGKGMLELIQAWSILRPEGWELVIGGTDDDGYEAIVADLARTLRAPAVTFHGAVADHAKWDFYRSAELFILPTLSENFGLVVAEALASGLPVITTRSAPWAELVAHRCGWWVDTGVEALVESLRDALGRSPAELASMGARGRELIVGRYSWDRIAADMMRVYQWVCGSGPQPAVIHTV